MWDWASFLHYIHSPYLLTGAAISLGLSVGAMLIGLIFGVIAAMMRMSERRWLRLPASGYVWLFRGTPVLVQLIIIYTGLPQLGIQLGVVASALIGLGLNEGAYLAEIIRGGLQAIPKGQYEAADALGLSFTRKMRLVILPQAITTVIPPLVNTFIGTFKDTSLVIIIGLMDLLGTANNSLNDAKWRGFYWEAYIFVGAIYWCFCFFMSKYSQHLERDLNKARRR